MNKIRQEYDFIIIGGGATGCGIALDVATRGYKVLLLEKNDFGSGASSKSTKLVHGGVRYLEKAILNLNKAQFKLVNEVLAERFIFLKNAPNISKSFQILSPVYSWFQTIYLYCGLKIYEFLSGAKSLGSSTFVSKKELSFLHKKNLIGAISFYDGSFNDSQMITSLLITAQKYKAVLNNYCKVKEFLYDDEKVIGVKYFDKFLEKEFELTSKVIINASGIDIDTIRKIDDISSKDLITTSKGSHIVLPKEFLPSKKGILIPKTEDGRVIFFHPWNEVLIIGTTELEIDGKCSQKISEEEVSYLLFYANKYLKKEATKDDIISTFSGVRALRKDELKPLSSIVREHIISISKSNLVSIGAGKWTTYRKMAEECLEAIFKEALIEKKDNCKTKNCQLLPLKSLGINEADIIYAIENYFVKRAVDILIRITVLALKDNKKTLSSIEFVCEVMAKYFLWSDEKKQSEIEYSINYITSRFL
ncbi:MAG: FAD-dependent oxidoreductase [Arcobacter sp.]|uniref:glycerol-3-phosphate dehydrogenase/oxidase n=1 Tax=Arcobacter sp. TaxID=1872629 RepID=UPI003B00B743